jgi:ubiquinone/menaquinone biosynthesis C-methylase UbiE
MPYAPDYNYIPPLSWPMLTPPYDFSCALMGLGKRFKVKVLQSLPLENAATVADIGCGTGAFLKIAKQKYPNTRFIGIDPDKQALGVAERRFEKARLPVELKNAFAEALPLDDNSMDACFSVLVFHHLPNAIKEQAIREMHRVLKAGGSAVIADFGERRVTFLRKILFFEKLEYIQGNFKGLIPHYLRDAHFKNINVVNRHFPGIDILIAEK